MTAETRPHTCYGVDRYLNVRTAHTPTFSPDGRSLAFVSDITGVPQLWQVPVEGGWPEQLTFTSDRVIAGHYAHELPEIVFGMDSGGDEREQLFLLRRDEVIDVAVDPAVMHLYGAIAPDDRQLAFSDNRRHPAFFDVYVRNLESLEERSVYRQDGSNTVVDWSVDGELLLIDRRTGARDHELFTLDLRSGEATHLTPHTAPTLYQQAAFAPDVQSLYLITNQDSEFARAARMDLTGHQIEFLTADDHDVDWLSLSPDGRLLAMVRNVEGYGVLSIRSLVSGDELRTPDDLPSGVVMQPVWANDSRALAFSFTAPAYNANIWVWDLEDGECRQITHASGGGIPREAHVEPELIHFPSFDGRLIPAFLYMPDAERPAVVVNVHGGPESQATPAFDPVTQYLVNRGHAVLAPNVRGSTGYGRAYTHLDDVEKRMDSVADLQAAADWLRSSGRVNGERIAVLGGSYGGFMVLAALTAYPETWAAGVDRVGIANFETFLRNTGAYRRHWRIPEYGDPDRDADLFRRISPIHHVDRIQAPLMVIHGDNDPRVPLSEAEQIVRSLQERGKPVEFLHFSDEGHGIVKLGNKLVAYGAIGEFLERYLG